MISNNRYTCNLTQGTSAINECLLLLSVYREGLTRSSFFDYVIEGGYLSNVTVRRASNLVKEVFYSRFLKDNPQVPLWLQTIRNNGMLLGDFSQLLLIYCARQHRVTYEFILDHLNPLRKDGREKLNPNIVDEYVHGIVQSGKANWSDSIQHKNASYIRSTLTGFGLIKSNGTILSFLPADSVILYLMHELHFSGLSDVAIVNDTDWQLLGLDKEQVIQRILDLNMKGGFIAQRCADLITISWNYKTMEEFINAAL